MEEVELLKREFPNIFFTTYVSDVGNVLIESFTYGIKLYIKSINLERYGNRYELNVYLNNHLIFNASSENTNDSLEESIYRLKDFLIELSNITLNIVEK